VEPPPASAAAYESFYGLVEPPFSAAADLKFLYHSTAHDHAAQSLLSAMARHDQLVVLVGQEGVGKTMLCRVVMGGTRPPHVDSFIADPRSMSTSC